MQQYLLNQGWVKLTKYATIFINSEGSSTINSSRLITKDRTLENSVNATTNKQTNIEEKKSVR